MKPVVRIPGNSYRRVNVNLNLALTQAVIHSEIFDDII